MNLKTHNNTLTVVWQTLLGLLLTLMLVPLMAEEGLNQTINIKADKTKINLKTGIFEYTGKVIMTQGNMRLSAQQVIAYKDKNGNWDRFLMSDKLTSKKSPVDNSSQERTSFRQLTNEGIEIKGYAKRMEYYFNESKLILIDQAEIRQGNDQFQSPTMEYNTQESTFTAERTNSNSPERVRMIITPKISDKTEEEPTPKNSTQNPSQNQPQ